MIGRSNSVRLTKIIEHCNYLFGKTVRDGMTLDIFRNKIESDIDFRYMISMPLFHTGENVSRLSGDIKNKYPNMEWNNISRICNQLVQDYDNINWNFITEVVYNDLSPLCDYCKMIMESERTV